MYKEFKENLKVAQAYFELKSDDSFDELYAEIDVHIEELESLQSAPDSSAWSPTSMEKSAVLPSDGPGLIFHDVDG